MSNFPCVNYKNITMLEMFELEFSLMLVAIWRTLILTQTLFSNKLTHKCKNLKVLSPSVAETKNGAV